MELVQTRLIEDIPKSVEWVSWQERCAQGGSFAVPPDVERALTEFELIQARHFRPEEWRLEDYVVAGRGIGGSLLIDKDDRPRESEYTRQNQRRRLGGPTLQSEVLSGPFTVVASFCCGRVDAVSTDKLRVAYRASRTAEVSLVRHSAGAAKVQEYLNSRAQR